MKIYKKNKPLNILFLCLLIITGNSCSDDFLEVVPNGVIIAEDIDDYEKLLNPSYVAEFRVAEFSEITQLRSFEVCSMEPYFSEDIGAANPARNNFTWQPNVFDEGQGVDFITTFTEKLYTLNKIINEVLSSSGGTEEEKKILQARAMARRASVYFEFVNLFGKPYNNGTSSSDLGVPIILEADVTETSFTRATVEEVYNFIIEDLTAAIPLLNLTTAQKPHMSQPAAKALLGKVYMYMGRFNEAMPLFDEALNSFQNDPLVGIYDYNVSTLPGGAHEPWIFGMPRFVNPREDFEAAYYLGTTNLYGIRFSTILLSPEVSSLYGPGDIRLNTFYSRREFPNLPFLPEYNLPGAYRKMGFLYNNRGVKIPDIYLLRAEARARINNLSGAIEDLEHLRMHRIDNLAEVSVPAGLSQDDLVKYVFDERTREFALIHGELWHDMRRLWDDPLFQDKKPYTHTVYNEDGSVKETYTLDEKRLVIRFSQEIMDENPGLINNPE